MDSIRRVGALRRQPTTCLYCTAPADSIEHVLPEAIGGRLTARILCARHNAAASPLDAAVAEHYAFLTWVSNAARQRGGREHFAAGARLRFVDANGRETLVDPDGSTRFARVAVATDPESGSCFIDGPRTAVERIAEQQNRGIFLEIITPGVTIPVGVGVTHAVLPGLLKAALHFAAGFVAAPAPATLAAVAPYFAGRPVPAFLLPFRTPWFDASPPARHELTLYPDRGDAVVTIMLYSSIIVALRLPHFVTERALRYVQLLDGTGPQLLPIEVRPILHERLSDREIDHMLTTTCNVVRRMMYERHLVDLNELAQAAAREALGKCAVFGHHLFLYFFRAALEKTLADPDEINGLVREAAARQARGLNPIDLVPMVV